MLRATSNETLSGGTDISAALKTYFPLLSDKDLAEYAEQYPFIDFVNATQQFRFATGESELKCAVSASHHRSISDVYADLCGRPKSWAVRMLSIRKHMSTGTTLPLLAAPSLNMLRRTG